MREFLSILVAMFAVFGFYSALYELKNILFRIAERCSKKIDNDRDMGYNNKNKM